MKFLSRLVILTGFLTSLILAGYSSAQEKSFSLELNSAKDNEAGCRLTFVAVNNTGVVLDETKYEVVLFDKDGAVSLFLALPFGKLTNGKTRVLEFVMSKQKCDNISRVLVNEVSVCMASGKSSTVCIDNLKTSSRINIKFGI